jgi:hypothetical protein
MYAIDVQYTQYETALTREMQEGGFAALTTAEALGTAATLVTPVVTKSILSALTTAVIATRGHYNSEVLLALTMRTIQKQMRASRNNIAAQISARMNQSVVDYPLSAALSDLEDYYLAGTLTTGVIDTSTTVGIEERASQEIKQQVTQVPLAQRAAIILRDTTTPITAPMRLSVSIKDGQGIYEQRLLPSKIKQFQKVVCMPENGKFSAQLRDLVIKHLGANKDGNFPGQITVTDGVLMTEDFNRIPAGEPNPDCARGDQRRR